MRLKESASRTLKTHQYVRTNQFEIEAKLDGLVEKFDVLNRNDLAVALTERRRDLQSHRNRWHPELVSLLLELSNRPVENADLNGFEDVQHFDPSPQTLAWEDILREDPYSDDDVWAAENYSDASSGDQLPSTRAATKPRARPSGERLDPPANNAQHFVIPADLNALLSLRESQLRQLPKSALKFRRSASGRERIPELILLKEVLLMLRGLPTSTFSSFGPVVAYDRQINITGVQEPTLTHILVTFADQGTQLNRLRVWLERQQDLPLLQAFQAAVSSHLADFDTKISALEQRFTDPDHAGMISFLRVELDVEVISRPILCLADLASKVSGDTRAFACLELLFHDICRLQAVGEHLIYECLAKVFFACLQIYFEPVRLWMEEGEINIFDPDFFIFSTGYTDDLSSLWRDHFELRKDEGGKLLAPSFLQPEGNTILVAGKSIVFLKKLGVELKPVNSTVDVQLTFHSVCAHNNPTDIAPFSDLFEIALRNWIQHKYRGASAELMRTLFQECDLSRDLDALEYIFLSRDGSRFQEFANQVFVKMDKQNQNWNDRFTLSDLAQQVFGSMSNVDAAKISMRSLGGSNLEVSNRSIRALKQLEIDYSLSWPTLNIITRTSLKGYQTIFSLFLQIYRAKFLLCQNSTSLRFLTMDPLTLAVRQRLLWFTDVFFSYIVDTVVVPEVLSMRSKFSEANDVDTLATLLQEFVTRILSKCLLTNALRPIRDAVMSILDLAVLFRDAGADKLNASSNSKKMSRNLDAGNSPSTDSRFKKSSQNENSSDEDYEANDLNDADMETLPDREAGHGWGLASHEKLPPYDDPAYARAPYEQRMKMLQSQFGQLCNFASAGLRSVGRASGETCHERLADLLDWGMYGRV